MLTAPSQTGCLQVVSFKMELSSDVSFEQDREGTKLVEALNAHLSRQAGACSSLSAQCSVCSAASLRGGPLQAVRGV